MVSLPARVCWEQLLLLSQRDRWAKNTVAKGALYFSLVNRNLSNTNMSEKHLKRGSACPPLQKDKLRLYSMRFCPYAQRVHLVLDAKKIPHDVVNVNLTDKPDWLFDMNPVGKVPALVVDGDVIYESLIISDYLDEKYPQRPLYPDDPLKKAKDKILIEHFNKVVAAMFRVFFSLTENTDRDYFKDILSGMDLFEKELVARNSPYFGGEKPGMVDFMIWPWCERSDLLNLFGERFRLPKERYMRLMEWKNAMKEDDAVKCNYLQPETHGKYLKSRLAGYPDYDILVSSL